MSEPGGSGIMKINPDLVSPCGLYCGVCAIFTKAGFPAKASCPTAKIFQQKTFNAAAACRIGVLCIAGSAKSGNAHRRKVSPDAINAMSFPAGTLKIFRWRSAKRSYCGLFHTGGKSVLKDGLIMKRPAMYVLNAAT